jgi:hypothetical protein
MPSQVSNVTTLAKDPTLLAAITAHIAEYADSVLGVETPIVSPNAGYKAYNKRVALAVNVNNAPELYASKFAVDFVTIGNDIVLEAQNNNIPLLNYLRDGNPMAKPACEADSTTGSSWQHVGQISGRSVWDSVAGVNQADLI